MEPGSVHDMSDWPLVEVPRHGEIKVHPHVANLIIKDKEECCPQRTPQWYEKRRNHLTASSIASAVGDNPYDTRMTAIRKKIGLGPPFKGNEATEHGNYYEDIAVKIYEERTGEKQIEFGLLESIKTTHKGEACDTSFLAGSPDGITANNRLLEVKCPFRRKPNGSVPKIYTYQIQGLMHELDIPICDFVEYVPENTWTPEVFDIITVVRSDIWWDNVFPVMQRFWEEVIYFRNEQENKGDEHVLELTEDKKTTRPRKPKPAPPLEIVLPEVLPPRIVEEIECDTEPMSLQDMMELEKKNQFVPWEMNSYAEVVTEELANREVRLQEEEEVIAAENELSIDYSP